MAGKRRSIYTWGLAAAVVTGALVLAWTVWLLNAQLGQEPLPTPAATTTLSTDPPRILIADFEDRSEGRHTGSTLEEDIYQALRDRVRADGLDLQVARLNEVVDEYSAAYTGRTRVAALLVWGWYDDARVQPHVERIEALPGRPSTIPFCALDNPTAQIPNLAAFALGVYAHDQGHDARALESLDTAKEGDLACAAIHNQRGLVYQAQGDYQAALTAFSRAIELEPENADLYVNRGRVFTLMEEHNAAHADFEHAWELERDIASLFN